MFGNLWPFIVAVADHWFFWIGVVLMVEPYLEGAAPRISKALKKYLAKHPARRKLIFRAAGVLALLIAFFQAWNVQYEAAGHNQNRLAMKELISTIITEGENLNKDWFNRNDDDAFKHEINLWTNKTGHLIEDAYGKGEVSIWMSDAGYTSFSDGKARTDLHNWIIHRLQRLNELMTRIDSVPLQPKFDPTKYKWVTECSDC